MKRIVAISGSVKQTSINSSILLWLQQQIPDGVHFQIYNGLTDLPYFNPDNDKPDSIPHPAVAQMRQLLLAANGVIICTPEYAKGVPGVLKNALDWLVSSGELVHKRVATISASPMVTGGQTAHQSLRETLQMVTATLSNTGAVTIALASQKIVNEVVVDEQLQTDLKNLLYWVSGDI